MQINWFKNKYLCNNLQKIESVLKSVYEDTMNTMNGLITILIQNMMVEQENTYKLTNNTIKMCNKSNNFNYKSANRLQNRKNKQFIVKNNRFRYNNQNRSVIRH